MKQKINGKSFVDLSLCAAFIMLFGLACSNPLAKYSKQYNCSVPGEPEPQVSDDYVGRGYKHMEMDDYKFNQCAFDAAAEAIRLDPQNARAYDLRGKLNYLRGTMAFDKKDEATARTSLEAALKDLDEAIRLKPDMSQFYLVRSDIYAKSWFLGDTRRKVLDDLTKADELCKDDCYASLHEKRGALNLELGNYEAAVEDYTKAIKSDPKEKSYYEKRAEAYRKLGKNDLADKDDATFPATDETDVKSSPEVAPRLPLPSNRPVPKTISGGVINGKASNLVQPPYPAAAKAVRASGAVNVQVTINEQGNVISASAVSGHPLLRPAAVQAARSSKFNPTILSGTPVKVTGVIVYNFVPE